MTKILFVCHGNICRSAAAEMILTELCRRRGLGGRFEIGSAAVSREEIGNDIYPPMKRVLTAHGIPCLPHSARQMTRADYARYDCLLGMDGENLRGMRRIAGGDPEGKLRLLLDCAGEAGAEIEDPWYTGRYEAVYQQILRGCEGLLRELTGA